MRCGDCGATNADTADWCSQCYADLRLASSTPERPSPSPSEPVADRGPVADPRGVDDQPTADGFRRRDGTVEWECPACGDWNTVESLRCNTCGTTIAARWDGDADRAAAERRFSQPWTAILALTAVVPGAGHIGLNLYGAGLARAVLYAVWLAGGVALWRAGGALAGAPLVLGAALLWAVSLADVVALRRGGRELLGGRSLLWLVVAVMVLSLVGVFTAAAGAPGAGPSVG